MINTFHFQKTKFQHRYSLSVQENVGRKASRRLQHALEKKASKMFLKASQTTGIGLSFPSSRRQLPTPSNVIVEDTAPEEQEMENYLLLTASLHKLMQSERSLVARILSPYLRPQVLEATVRDAMDLVVHDGENIASRAKRCIGRRDFSAVLVVFPILKHLGELKPDFERTVEGCDYTLRSKFASLISTLNSTVRKINFLYFSVFNFPELTNDYIVIKNYETTSCKLLRCSPGLR